MVRQRGFPFPPFRVWLISSATFITDAERTEINRRMTEDCGALSTDFDLRFVAQALKDWKIYINMLIGIGAQTPVYAISFFLPTIIHSLGYTANAAQLMSVPPYVVACLFTLAASYTADKRKQRGIILLVFQLIGITGFAMSLSKHVHVQYAGTFLAAIGKALCSPVHLHMFY
jgi:cyanate permease